MNESLNTETMSHQSRVAELCVTMGKELDINPGHLNILRFAGLFHDIGKSEVPKEIIEKNGSLTPDEREIVKRHVRSGFEQLSDKDFNTVKKVVVAHHEFIRHPYPRSNDRRGQKRPTPDRRSGNKNIRLLAQILALCDMYDALVSRREYKEPYEKEKAFEIIRTEFTGDKELVRLLWEIV